MNKIACTHPGKIGDTLYALSAVKKACQLHHAEVDFYTSKYCEPLKRLFEYQSYIQGFYIPDSYKIERMDMGVQPWRMPVDVSQYEMVYHLGFRSVPDKSIPDFICESVGFPIPAKVEYEYEEFDTFDFPYIVVAPRGETTFKDLFRQFVFDCPIHCVIVGGIGDYIDVGFDETGLDFLETATFIAKSVGFVGLMSSQLCLANGFNIPKIAPHDGIHWDMRHAVYSDKNFYPINPEACDIIKMLDL